MPSLTGAFIKTAKNTNPGPNSPVQVDQLPNICPVCHVTIEPEPLSGTQFAIAFDWFEAYYRCTNLNCRRQFTAFYRRDAGASLPGALSFRFLESTPVAPLKQAFDKAVTELSPSFVEIYAQAQAADEYGLAEIAGPGFRKALEFLIKDYAIKLNPGHDEEIKSGPLAKVIQRFLAGDKLAVVSSRAAWLGNDETHYERRWVDKDLQDLKKLISATVHFIAMERLVAELPTDMPTTGPSAPPTI